MGLTRRHRTVLPAILLALTPLAGKGIDDDLERAVGRAVFEAMKLQYGALEDPLLAGWVDRVGQAVAAGAPRQDYPYVFAVIDTDAVNAFAAPGCFILVTKGLLEQARSDDEVAAVLAHEVGHCSERHAPRLLEHEGIILLAETLLRDRLNEWVMLGLQLAHLFETLGFSRHLENRADRFGLRRTYEAGFDPTAMAEFLETIRPARPPSGLGAYLDTHPPVHERIAAVQASLYGAGADATVLRTVADGLYDRMRLRPAAAYYRRLAAAEPADPHARARLASIAARWGRLGEARRELALAEAIDPEAPEVVAAAVLVSQATQDLTAEPADDGAAVATDLRLAAADAAQRQQALGSLFESFAERVRRVRELRREARLLDTLLYARPSSSDWTWWTSFAHVRSVIISLDRALARSEQTRNTVRATLADLRRLGTLAAAATERSGSVGAELSGMADSLRSTAAEAERVTREALRDAGTALGHVEDGIGALELALGGMLNPLRLAGSSYTLGEYGGLQVATLAARTHADRALSAAGRAYRSTVRVRLRTVDLRLRLLCGGLDSSKRKVCRAVVAYRFNQALPEQVAEPVDAAWAAALGVSRNMDARAAWATRELVGDWVTAAERLGADLDAVRLALDRVLRHLEDALPT